MITSKTKCIFFLSFFQGESNKSREGSGTEQVRHEGGELPHGGGEKHIHSGMYAIK